MWEYLTSMAVDQFRAPQGNGQRPGSPSLRSLSRARIISAVRRNAGVTRAGLSRLSGLSKSTVSTVVSELLDQRFLYEDGDDLRKRNNLLYLNRDAGVAIGFEVRPGEARGMLTDMGMRILRRCVRSLPNNLVQTTADTLASMHEELVSDIALPCLGVVVAVPGPTDRAGQILMSSTNLGWSNVPLGRILSERLHESVSVVNVPHAMAIGEYWYGAGGGAQFMIQLNVSSGIGAAILVGGQVFLGAQGYSSEIGHTTILPDGPKCRCGNRGCLEQLASVPAILQQVCERARREGADGGHCVDARSPAAYTHLVEAALDGDPVVMEVIRQASQYLGIAVANLIDLFNPNVIVVGGPLAELGALLVNGIREAAQRRAFPLSFQGVEIVPSRLAADAACTGACTLVMERYFTEV